MSPPIHQRGPRTAMPLADRIWLGLDLPSNPMVVTAVLEFAAPVDIRQLRTVLTDRLLAAYPRFSQRVVPGRWPFRAPHWEDADVDFGVHLRQISTDAELEVVVDQLLGQRLDPGRPPWQCHLVTTRAGDALVVRLHHCIADGIALAGVLMALTDGATDLGFQPPQRARPRPAGLFWLVGVVGGTLWSGLRLLTLPRKPRTSVSGRPGGVKRSAWTAGLPLADVKAVASAGGGSVNDVLLAVTAGALRRYLLEHGSSLPGLPPDLRVFIPVNVRPGAAQKQLGNHLGLLFPRLPVSEPDPIARVAAVSGVMTALKATAEAAATSRLIWLLGMLPNWTHALAGAVLGSKGIAVVTNVPGPRHPVRLAGVELSRLTFWVPQVGSIGIGISMFSYAGTVTIGVAADAGVLPTPSRLTDALTAEFAELRRAAGVAG